MTHRIINAPDLSAANDAVQRIRFTSALTRADSGPVMDKFWSICAMPIGVAICMLPAAVVWWFIDRKKAGPDDAPKTKKV